MINVTKSHLIQVIQIHSDIISSIILENDATVTIYVICLRGSIEAKEDEATTPEDTLRDINPVGNGINSETGDPLELTNVETPPRGSVETDGNKVTYTPEPCKDYERDGPGQYQVQFGYSITDQDDAAEASSTITVTVICNNRPTAEDDLPPPVVPYPNNPEVPNPECQTNEDTPINLDVLDNDTDPENAALEVNAVTQQPLYDSAAVSADKQSIVYYPDLIDIQPLLIKMKMKCI